jgi:hypothetical protein
MDKYKRLVSLLKMKAGERLLDIASGKAEFVVQMMKEYKQISVTAIDKSPYHSKDGMDNIAKQLPKADVNYLVMDAAEYKPEKPNYFDVTVCLGADWIYGGYEGTIKAMIEMTKNNGHIVLGEPFWRSDPPKEFLEKSGLKDENFGTHYDNVKTAENFGLHILYTIVSNKDDWDTYEGLQWYSAEKYAQENPDDKDIDDLLKTIHKDRDEYLKWRRDYLGWAIYVFMKD